MRLTERQKQILCLAASGMLAKECAHALGVTVRTVEAHRVQATIALGARNTVHAVAIAISLGIIPQVTGMQTGARFNSPTATNCDTYPFQNEREGALICEEY